MLYKVKIECFCFYDKDEALDYLEKAVDTLCEMPESKEISFLSLVVEDDD